MPSREQISAIVFKLSCRHTDRQTDRQTDTHTHTSTKCIIGL